MAESSRRSSVSGTSQNNALVVSQWQPILQSQNQIVLYNALSKSLTVGSIHPSYDTVDESDGSTCPYCLRPLDEYNHPTGQQPMGDHRAPNYFHFLAAHNESTSRPLTPPHFEDEPRPPLGSETMAEGYFDAFFREESKLGMGANGSVFLCQHVLDGNPLGRFAVKKIAVGSSHEYLVKILKEVRLLETLRHPNIITYHHSWLESCRFSTFGPSVPTLFILMQWAEGGSLDDFIAQRQGIAHGGPGQNPASPESEEAHMTREQRIAAFRTRMGAGGNSASRAANLKAVHLLSTEEIVSLLWDITSGLDFLHNRSILHLDLKPGNVLLTWDHNALIPRGMLSDFGAARDMLQQGSRTGVTGTLEYTAPEIIMPDPTTGALRQMDSKSDIWSLGIILHKLIFFHTPWRNGNDDLAMLEQELIGYPGFVADASVTTACSRRGLPSELLTLLQSLLDRTPGQRPSCEKIIMAIEEQKRKYVRASGSPASRSRPAKRERDGAMAFPTFGNTLIRTHSHSTSDTSPERSFNPSVTNGVVRPRLRLPSDAGTIVPDRGALASESQETPKIESSNRGSSPLISLAIPTRARASSYDSHEDASDDPPPRTPISSSMRHRRQGPPSLLARSRGKRRNGGGTAPSTPVTATHRHEVALPVSKNLETSVSQWTEVLMGSIFKLPPEHSRALLKRLWWLLFREPSWPSDEKLVRDIRVVILFGKMISLAHAARQSSYTPQSHLPLLLPPSVIIPIASALAAADIWRPSSLNDEPRAPRGPRYGLAVSAALTVVHALLMRLM